jgi:hypothetical protein
MAMKGEAVSHDEAQPKDAKKAFSSLPIQEKVGDIHLLLFDESKSCCIIRNKH